MTQMNPKLDKRKVLYSVYRTKDDRIIAFELPAARVAEIMGITLPTFYSYVSQQAHIPNRRYKYKVYRTKVSDLTDD